jgi:signal peptidase I
VKFDFALILTVLSAFTGIVWLVDRLFFAKSRNLMVNNGEEVSEPVIVDYSRSLFPVLFLVLVLRSFLAEPFRIPSESMMPNLLIGDFILVNKYSYGIRLPVLNTKIIPVGEPKRGDVVVFRYPGNPVLGASDPDIGVDYIKRIIGLPGDTVQVSDDRVTVNGQVYAYQPEDVFTGTGPSQGAPIVREMLPGHDHTILDEPGHSPFMPQEQVVPPGHYFAMGDNRDHSADSREWGFVPEQNLVGRAMVIWLNCSGWVCSDGFDYRRIGDTIR